MIRFTVNKKWIRRIAYAAIAGLVAFCATSIWVFRTRWQVRDQLEQFFASDANNLTRTLQRNPELGAIQVERLKRAIHVLEAPLSDKTVVLFNINVEPAGRDGPFIMVDYVDKCASVAQVNYQLNDVDSNGLGSPFIGPEDLPPCHMRHVGIFTLYVHLKSSEKLAGSGRPYTELDGEIYRLVVPKSLFDNIMQRKGRLVLVSQNTNVLDAVALADLDGIRWWGNR
jgi:hypothetical protein